MERKHTEGVLFHCGRLQTRLEFNTKRNGKNGNFFTLQIAQRLSTVPSFYLGMKYIMNHLLTYEIPITLSFSSPLTSSWDSLITVLGKRVQISLKY